MEGETEEKGKKTAKADCQACSGQRPTCGPGTDLRIQTQGVQVFCVSELCFYVNIVVSGYVLSKDIEFIL